MNLATVARECQHVPIFIKHNPKMLSALTDLCDKIRLGESC